jgi:hypothetical protein
MTIYQYDISEGFKRRFLALEGFMNELERLLTAGGVSSGLKTRALKLVLRYVANIEAKANYVSETELLGELVKGNPTAAVSEDTLQLLRRARRAAVKMRK